MCRWKDPFTSVTSSVVNPRSHFLSDLTLIIHAWSLRADILYALSSDYCYPHFPQTPVKAIARKTHINETMSSLGDRRGTFEAELCEREPGE